MKKHALALAVLLFAQLSYANPCSIALENIALPAQAPLSNVGFSVLSAAEWFQLGDFIAHQEVDGLTLYNPFYTGRKNYDDIVGFKRRVKHGSPSVAFLLKRNGGDYSVVEYNAGGGGMTDFKMDPAQYIGKTMAQQLTESGFALVSGSADMYRFVQAPDDSFEPPIRAAELLVRLNSAGAIAQIYQKYRLSFYNNVSLGSLPYRVLGGRINAPSTSWGNQTTSLDMTNGLMTFTVSSDNHSSPYNIRLQMDLAQIPDSMLHTRTLDIGPKTDASSGFVEGGVNATSAVRTLTNFRRQPIEDLQSEMAGSGESSHLAPGEDLLAIMAADNQLVVDTWKTTHQALVASFLRVVAAIEVGLVSNEFTYNGIHYRIENAWAIKGMVQSPFDPDLLLSNKGSKLVRKDTGASIQLNYSDIELVARYGFYGGPRALNGQRRLNPEALRTFFVPAPTQL